jgi:hypothetical protein
MIKLVGKQEKSWHKVLLEHLHVVFFFNFPAHAFGCCRWISHIMKAIKERYQGIIIAKVVSRVRRSNAMFFKRSFSACFLALICKI